VWVTGLNAPVIVKKECEKSKAVGKKVQEGRHDQ